MAHMTGLATKRQRKFTVLLSLVSKAIHRPPPPDTRDRNSGGIRGESYTYIKRSSYFQWFCEISIEVCNLVFQRDA